mgnify:CR=1 FL=1|jgi:hypothetical protein
MKSLVSIGDIVRNPECLGELGNCMAKVYFYREGRPNEPVLKYEDN